MNKKRIVFSVILASVLIILGAVSILIMDALRGTGVTVTVTVDGELYGTYSLSENRSYELNGGTNLLTVRDGYAYMERASCPGQDCVHHNKISRTGERIVCTYYRISVVVKGSDEEIFIN